MQLLAADSMRLLKHARRAPASWRHTQAGADEAGKAARAVLSYAGCRLSLFPSQLRRHAPPVAREIHCSRLPSVR